MVLKEPYELNGVLNRRRLVFLDMDLMLVLPRFYRCVRDEGKNYYKGKEKSYNSWNCYAPFEGLV